MNDLLWDVVDISRPNYHAKLSSPNWVTIFCGGSSLSKIVFFLQKLEQKTILNQIIHRGIVHKKGPIQLFCNCLRNVGKGGLNETLLFTIHSFQV